MSFKVRNQIRKLFALANDSGATEGEKTNSLLAAQKLMLKHGIEEEQILSNDIEDKAIEFKRNNHYAYKKPITDYRSLKFWEKRLALIIADNFRCYTYTESWNKKKRIVFLGMKNDTEIAADVFHFASQSIIYLSNKFMDDKSFSSSIIKTGTKNEYIAGFLDGLRDKFKEQIESNGFDVELAKDALVELEYIDIKFTKGSASKVTMLHDKEVRQQGYKDGKELNYKAKQIGTEN